jgi:hypothetical protein
VNAADIEIGSGDVLTLICAIMFAFQILFLGRFVSNIGLDADSDPMLQLS